MIDYIKCNFECDHDKNGVGSDFMAKIPLAQLQDDTYFPCGFYTGLDVKGKHGSNIKINTLGGANSNKIQIEGNPAKFLQGHNLFGINDASKLIFLTVKQLIENTDLGLNPTQAQLEDIKNGMVKITRLDINRNFHLRSKIDADRWIIEARDGMTMSHYGQVKVFNSSLYFGKGEKTKELKFYAKGAEIIANNSLPRNLQTLELVEYANKLLRFEIRFNSKWLSSENLSYALNWNDRLVESLLDESLSRIKLSGNMQLTDEKLLGLKSTLLGTYNKWLDGHCLKDCLKPSAFYRHKRELLQHGVDISIVLPQFKKRTLNLQKVLTDNVVGIPEWAYEQNLVMM